MRLPDGPRCAATLRATLGALPAYSNLGIATLGRLIERRNPDGLAFAEYVEREVLRPLELTKTGFGDVSLVPGYMGFGASNEAGRTYLVYGNYEALLDYNCAHAYALTVALLADRIGS